MLDEKLNVGEILSEKIIEKFDENRLGEEKEDRHLLVSSITGSLTSSYIDSRECTKPIQKVSWCLGYVSFTTKIRINS